MVAIPSPPPFWSWFRCDYVLLASKVYCNEIWWLWMKEVFPSLLPSPILPPELNQPFSPCRQSLLLASHIGFHHQENNCAINSHFSMYPIEVGYISFHSGPLPLANKLQSYQGWNRNDVISFSLEIMNAHEHVNGVTKVPHADLFLW